MEQKRNTLLWTGLALASALLAVEPLKWLVHSWHDPSYQSDGGLYCLALFGLVGLSLKSSSPRAAPPTGRVFVLFLFAAGLRLLGQILAVNIVSALALAADIYALAALLRLEHRRFAISPFWLAVFFLFALPLGPILQRIAGYPLQRLSAEVACRMLSPVFDDLICEGVRLQVNGVDVLVDLPCSGASGLLLMVSLWAFLNVIYRPAFLPAISGLGVVMLFALLGNALRISLLASGLALGYDTMAQVPHVAIGVMTIALSAGLSLCFYRPTPARRNRRICVPWQIPRQAQLPIVACAIITALSIVSAPERPLDVSAPVKAAVLPIQLRGHPAVEVALSEIEQHYFTAFGGTAQKVQYGPLGLNLVSTSSPLRHLHSPETCLRGMGFEVVFKGTWFDPIPTSIYEATGPDGQVWTVAVSFISEQGYATASVVEAVWRWLIGTSRTWRSVQRITPAALPEPARNSYELATLAALDLP
ncbi:exosortase T [Roseobacter sp. EG26]|uniref:exosortase T n=1 Tax=Roseobacter sp. EG26 TaxID=3412477 RepID=UPI003CE52A1C